MRGIRARGPKVKWDNISLDQNVADRVVKLLYDPIHQRPIYGARSQLINRLLAAWADEQEARDGARSLAQRQGAALASILE